MWDFHEFLTTGDLIMKHKRYSENKFISILKEHDADASGKDLSCRHCCPEGVDCGIIMIATQRRWVVAPNIGINLRMDVARGRDDTIYFVSVGEAF